MSESQADFVVVGAGSAGCVLANRLSENPAHSVLLVEAGGSDAHPLIAIPAGVAGLLDHPRLNWRYKTLPQQFAGGRQIPLPRGKTLGGTSSINGMVYHRGHPSDYDGWAADGSTGWSYRELIPYFKRSEENGTWRDSPLHGTRGPMHVSDVADLNPLVEMFIRAGESLGLERCADFAGESMEGIGPRQATIRRGRRESSATAFLRPALGRKNLTVVTDALVNRVVLAGKRATAIEIQRPGAAGAQLLTARREIILSAGTFGSPGILLRSGIGNAQELVNCGITPQHQLRGVGLNLQDHITATAQYVTSSTIPYGASLRAWPQLAAHVANYVFRRRGLLASNVFEGTAFWRSDPSLTRPDVQFIFMPVHRAAGKMIPLVHGYGVVAVVLHPRSRGSVTIPSADPCAAPLVDPKFFSETEDMETLLRGLRFARQLLQAPSFAGLHGKEILPGPGLQQEDQLQRYIRQSATTVYHPVGTCHMGQGLDAVVDSELRVHGLQGLRVADASIMPSVPGGNTHAPVVMIGEKAADLVLGRRPPPAHSQE